MDVWECEYLLPLFMLTLCAAPVARHPVQRSLRFLCGSISLFFCSYLFLYPKLPELHNAGK